MARLVWLVVLLATAFAAGAQSRDRTLTLAPARPAAEARHALVIGNGAYVNGPLRNPVNDARAIARELRDVGFNVMLLEDATQPAMQRAVRRFGDQIAKGGVGLFYYAGHGIQAKGRNYLVPVNAEIEREYELEFNSVDVNLVLAMMDSAKNSLNIVILDACRNNPFARAFRSSQAGLAQMDAPTGTFIAFATAPGSVAADGAGEHGVYTKYLLAEIARPGVPIELMFKQVRNGVMGETNGQQIPWESSSLRGEFVFKAAPPAAAAGSIAETLKREREAQQREMEKMLRATLEAQRKESDAVELAFWESVRASNDAGDYRAYLEQYPQGRFASLARNRLAAFGQKPGASAPPVTVASVRPAPGLSPRTPAEGDTWTYELAQRGSAGGIKSLYVVRVQAATSDGILESIQLGGENPRQWAHSRGPAVMNLGMSLFSPYPVLLGELVPGMRLAVDNLDPRTCGPAWTCSVSARVVGRETMRVPAGTFETTKIEITQSWTTQAQTNDRAEIGGRTLTVWYAPEAKRAVKFASRGSPSRVIETDFDLELVSYKLR